MNAPIVLPPPNDPAAVAREVLTRRYHEDGAELLRRQGGAFYRYNGVCWPECPDEHLRAALYDLLEQAAYAVTARGNVALVDWCPTRHKVDDVVDALRSIVHVAIALAPPCWLNDAAGYLGLAGTNGLTKSRAVRATPRQPWSMVSEWPRWASS